MRSGLVHCARSSPSMPRMTLVHSVSPHIKVCENPRRVETAFQLRERSAARRGKGQLRVGGAGVYDSGHGGISGAGSDWAA